MNQIVHTTTLSMNPHKDLLVSNLNCTVQEVRDLIKEDLFKMVENEKENTKSTSSQEFIEMRNKIKRNSNYIGYTRAVERLWVVN